MRYACQGEMTGFAALVKASLFKAPKNKTSTDPAAEKGEPKAKLLRRLSSFTAAQAADQNRGELLRNLPARAVFVPPDYR
jgi:hypothetical protein